MKDRIKRIRKELDLTQQEFADRLGIKRGGIANYEVGRNEPADSVISLICREFDVNENWLRQGTGTIFLEKTGDERVASFIGSVLACEEDSFKKRFISLLSTLSESQWEALEKMTHIMQGL
ncbi:MAG: helix-turn-helix transcriptional regulator [Lachnospiraceae bacterium]|nr:helix-turn-helix transcriptional regulator [Lachnospiraceae bacterium]